VALVGIVMQAMVVDMVWARVEASEGVLGLALDGAGAMEEALPGEGFILLQEHGMDQQPTMSLMEVPMA
jgi:hypothetical protein